jgi:hypothetical protein
MSNQNTHTLVAYLHNGGDISVEGNAVGIDMLKGLLIPAALVSGIAVYEHGEPREAVYGPEKLRKIEQINHVKLLELRADA